MRAVKAPAGHRAGRPGEDPAALAQARRALRERLEQRRGEIERATLDRVYGISDPAEVSDPAYAQGLRATVSAALDYALEAIERGEEKTPPPPLSLLAQARLAARNGVSLDTVLRRYFAGYTLIGEFLAQEAAAGNLPAVPVQLLRGRAAVFDRLMAAVSEEYERETQSAPGSLDQRRAERVRRLIAGEQLETSGLAYDFDAHHLALVASGADAASSLRELAATLDCRLLIVAPQERVAWAWLGARRPLDPEELGLQAEVGEGVSLAFGEPGEALAGWRLSHRQAAAALAVAQRGTERVVRYREVALLASALRDELLITSLRQIYLEPLEGERDGGAILRETLRAYLAAGHNVSSTAAALGVSRQGAAKRLRAAEALFGRTMTDCGPELELALRVAEFDPAARGAAIESGTAG